MIEAPLTDLLIWELLKCDFSAFDLCQLSVCVPPLSALPPLSPIRPPASQPRPTLYLPPASVLSSIMPVVTAAAATGITLYRTPTATERTIETYAPLCCPLYLANIVLPRKTIRLISLPQT